MAFLFAKQFPAGCVVETDSDPAEIRLGGVQLYPVGVSLEQAMAWIWKSRAFTGSGSSQELNGCCVGNNPVYSVYNFPSSQSTSGLDAAKTKMSELICPDSYVTDFVFVGTITNNQCVGSPTSNTTEGGFGFLVNDTVVTPTPIYLYNEKYYLAIGYGFGAGFNLDDSRTYFVGNLTIDGIDFPFYSVPPECNATLIANFTCITSLEREAD